jgi:hypothetical protein
MAVFDALLEMEDHEEEILKQKLAESGISVGHLYKTKNYLYKIILDSLVGTNQEDEYELYTQIQKIIILILKSLFSHAEDLFSEAHRIASEQENFEAILILLGEERNLIKARTMQVESTERLKEIRAKELETAEKSYNLLQYNHLLDKANALFRYQGEEKERQLQEIVKNPLMHGERQFRSTSSRILYWLIKGRVDLANHDYDLSQLALENAAFLYEQHPGLLKGANSFRNYLDLLKNLMMIHLVTQKLSLAWSIGAKLKRMAQGSEKGRFLILERYFNGMLSYMEHTTDLSLGTPLIADYKEFYREFGGRVNKYAAGINDFLIANFLIATQNAEEALGYIYRILNMDEEELRPQTIMLTRILQLLAFYDLREFRYLAQAVRSAKDFQRRKGVADPGIREMLGLFQQLANAEGDQQKMGTLIHQFAKEWEAASQGKTSKGIADVIRLSAWLERHRQ